MNSEILLSFLDSRRQPLASEQEAQRLNELCAATPRLARQALTDPSVHVSRKAQLLAGLLATSQERGEIEAALRALPADELLAVLDGLRPRKINNRRAREIALRALLRHERLAEIAA